MTPQIIAHRGASYLAPENTLTAFKKAMEIGADGVEMDVQQTIDAGLVIHHDYMIDLHTDISGKIYDMTMGDLKELDFGSWKDAIYQDEKIATLQEAMELCRQMPECTVHLELKSTMDNDPDFVPRVLEVLQQTEMVEQVILVSFNHALLRQAKTTIRGEPSDTTQSGEIIFTVSRSSFTRDKILFNLLPCIQCTSCQMMRLSVGKLCCGSWEYTIKWISHPAFAQSSLASAAVTRSAPPP